MSAFIWIAGLLALPASVTAIARLVVDWKAIKALRSLAELEGQHDTVEAKTRRVIAFGRMITRVAVERRTNVGHGGDLFMRRQSHVEANHRTQDPQSPTSQA